MAKKYYVVWVGRETGVFTSWDYTKPLIDKYPKARYKSFKTQAEAEAAFSNGGRQLSAVTIKQVKQQPKIMDTQWNSDTDVTIYCDGGCDPNPGEAASGVAVYSQGELTQLWYGLYNPHGTNNSAELNALNQSLLIAQKELLLRKSVSIFCDSQYSINCVTNWAYGWKQRGWKRKVEGDIKNLELIQQAHSLYDELKNKLTVSHVKAHIGIEGNELADRMSIYGVDQKEATFCQYSGKLDITALLKLRAG
ncbi:ribonuclease H family protein [Vibrio sp. Of7-15]|uniref:ribonuclease H family protein n=1 Tax=Vibrio sp. Of7-15 TaxID=2724879 RepID=UPI001EF1775D|nr:ribonuclease H family protein [Vibrio sp. Of7-15]MCG7495548.1 ribonuclease H family protein [Vibrio sp. Of7-15]